MKNNAIISVLALVISVVGLSVAVAAFFKRRSCILCDDLENDLVEMYDTDDCGDCGCGCEGGCGADAEVKAEAPAADEHSAE